MSNWQSAPRTAPVGKEWRKFRNYLANVPLTPQGRTDLNKLLKETEQHRRMDAKTQDDYEREISQLRRQNNTLQKALNIANQSITEAQDDYTPAPVLHMMNRLKEAETELKTLQDAVLEALVDCPDADAIATLGHQLHLKTCPSHQQLQDKDTIYQNLVDDVAQEENLYDSDYVEEQIDAAQEETRDELEDELTALSHRIDSTAEERDEALDQIDKLKTLIVARMRKNLKMRTEHRHTISAFQEALKIREDEGKTQLKNVKTLMKKLADTKDMEKKMNNYLEFIDLSESFGAYADWIAEYRQFAPESQTGVDMKAYLEEQE